MFEFGKTERHRTLNDKHPKKRFLVELPTTEETRRKTRWRSSSHRREKKVRERKYPEEIVQGLTGTPVLQPESKDIQNVLDSVYSSVCYNLT